jgi:hypothetical protein
MVYSLKQNGHPVTPNCIGFNHEVKTYKKEACDVRTHYSTLFPVSSNQSCQSGRFSGRFRGTNPDSTRQALSTHLSLLWTQGLRGTQLDRAQGAGYEPCRHGGLDQLSLSQGVLCPLSSCQRRRFRAVSPLFAGDQPIGPFHLPVVPADDRRRCGPAPEPGLEDGQRHRQILSGTRLWPTGLKRIADPGRGRNLHPQRASLSDRGTGLSQRPRGLCRQRSQGQNAATFFRAAQR